MRDCSILSEVTQHELLHRRFLILLRQQITILSVLGAWARRLFLCNVISYLADDVLSQLGHLLVAALREVLLRGGLGL